MPAPKIHDVSFTARSREKAFEIRGKAMDRFKSITGGSSDQRQKGPYTYELEVSGGATADKVVKWLLRKHHKDITLIETEDKTIAVP